MDFVYKIDTPAETPASSPLITTARLTRGRLSGGFLYFPTGPSGLLHFQARIGIHQILPFNVGQDYALDDCVIPIALSVDLPEPPYSVDLVTWNDSTLYEHTLTFGLFLDPLNRRKWQIKDAVNALSDVKGYKKP